MTKIGKKLCLKIVGPNSIFFLCVISHCKNMLDYGFSISSPSSIREPKSTFKPAVGYVFDLEKSDSEALKIVGFGSDTGIVGYPLHH